MRETFSLSFAAQGLATCRNSMTKYIQQQAKANPAPDGPGLDALSDDRTVVHRLFREFDRIADDADPSRKAELARAICREIAMKTKGGEGGN